MMNKNCDIIRDLLPLYVDKACSDASCEFLEAHLEECDECKELLLELTSTSIETELQNEKETAIRHHETQMKKKSFRVGAVISGILFIPILVCLIVNIAAGHALDWFFIVLASLLVFASLTVVPLTVSENKFLWCVTSFVVTVTALLAVCCIYTKGNWFFVAASATVFGLSLNLLPPVSRTAPLRGFLKGQKALFVISLDTALYALMMLSIGFFVKSDEYPRLAFSISLPFIILAWALFAVIRYLKANKAVKIGVCIFIVGVFTFLADSAVGWLIGSTVPLGLPHFSDFSGAYLDINIKWATLIGCTLAAVITVIFGIIFRKKENKK